MARMIANLIHHKGTEDTKCSLRPPVRSGSKFWPRFGAKARELGYPRKARKNFTTDFSDGHGFRLFTTKNTKHAKKWSCRRTDHSNRGTEK